MSGRIEPHPLPCVDCADLTSGTERIIRGGCFCDDASTLRTVDRRSKQPAERSNGCGVRCARNAP